ncbi:MAG: tetratricopeptide repeat protein [Acidobacteria bacterium]|jgi:Flp pilus assembly protein TadD|nr:tetratricopeptide repeat protein [Acidobacteriota bacterium]
MMAREAVACPACGTRNRPTWEFCARCNEPLEGARPIETAEFPAAAPEALEPVEGTSLAASGVLVVTVLAFGVLGVAAYRHVSTGTPPEGPDPNLFTIATRPAEPREAPPAAGPGVSDYDSGRLLLNSGDLDGAVASLAAAVAADPENARYRSYLANALWRAGSQELALAEDAEAARLDPRLRTQYARALDIAGRTEEARAEYEAVLERNPENPTIHEDLGRMLFRAGRYAEAASHLDEAVDARGDDAVLKQELAYALEQGGEKERAAEVYQEVLADAPQAAITRGLLAENLYERGKKDQALSVLEQGLELTPDAPLLQRQLGSLLEREGKSAEAAEAYRAYARLAPNAPDAQSIAERASQLAGRGKTP